MKVLFDVVHEPQPSGRWPVWRNGNYAGSFGSKTDAIAFAVDEARRLAMDHAAVSIHIEGADGAWRVFDESMRAPIAGELIRHR